jgi:PAS domain S-box-containing protein
VSLGKGDGYPFGSDPLLLSAVEAAGLAVVESVPEAFVIVDDDGHIIVMNSQAERLFGYERDELIGSLVETLIPKRFASNHGGHRAEFGADPHTRPMGPGLELFAVRKDGSEFPVEISLSPLQTQAGSVVVAAVRDVTESKRTETLFRGLVEAAPDGIVIVDTSGIITLVNAQAESMFGYPRAELIGASVDKLVPDRFLEGHVADRGRFVDDPRPRPMGEGRDLFAVRRDGSEFPVEISLSPLDADSGLLVIAAVRDLTERRRAHTETETAKLQAERANRAKSEFLSRMSHELRTPLNAILGFGQLLEMQPLSVRQDESLRQIMKAGHHLLDLVDEVLDIARIETGDLSVSPEAVSVGTAISETIQLMVPTAGERGITFEERQSHRDLFVFADRQRLRQVLLNLISNGVKYNHEGGAVVVETKLHENAQLIEVSVRDTGTGISEDMLQRVFEPFDRLDVDEADIPGTGLGLTLSRGLVEAMGGTLTLESTPDAGSAFTILLPRVEAPDSRLGETIRTLVEVKTSGQEKTILYIEDNLSNLKLVERVLEYRKGVKLLSAMQASLGIELAFTHQPDLVLLDLHLPDMRGDHVLARLRGDPVTASIPVVIITADATPGQMQRLLAAGAEAYLTKPLDVPHFLELVDQILDREV